MEGVRGFLCPDGAAAARGAGQFRQREAERAVQATYYAPKGIRSRSGLACVVYGDDYPAHANDLIVLVVMLETTTAVDNVKDILSVPGIDCCLIGPSDLSLSMNCELNSAAFEQAVECVSQAARAAGVACGLVVSSAKEAEKWQRKGVTMFLATHDTAMMKSAAVQFAASFDSLGSAPRI